MKPILRGDYSELGSLEGTIEVLDLHQSLAFIIREQLSGLPVRCSFPDTAVWKERIRSLMGKSVLVVGQISYSGNGVPLSVTHLEEVADMTPDPSLPKADFGTIPDLTGDMSTIDYLHKMRGQTLT